jgi:hypothetical protein
MADWNRSKSGILRRERRKEMTANNMTKRIGTKLLRLLLVAPLLLATDAAPTASAMSATSSSAISPASPALADPAFQRVWNHCDKPVEEGMAVRSWMWGPQPVHSTYEPYMEGTGAAGAGQHLVQYFDKSRMEINNPNGDRNSEWFVTNGLLVVDMISGRLQVGDNAFAPAAPAAIPVAGDIGVSVNAPTYASLAKVASLNADKRAPNRTGQNIREGLGSSGNVGTVNNLAAYTRYERYEPTTGHNIADVFWAFMNQKGVTYHDTGYMSNDTVVDWLFAMGYPITEPYWIQISVGGQDRWVLMQAFQRRILTYSPQNPQGWQVEMGNVGRDYYDWRYGQQPVPPAPTPVPTLVPTPVPTPAPTATPGPQATISIEPNEGNTNTLITVNGRNFPAYAAVIIRAEQSSVGYSRDITTVAASAGGVFTAQIKLPADAARLGEVQITASANGGAVRPSQTFKLTFEPAITATPREVVPYGAVRVQGQGFPAAAGVRLGMAFIDGTTQWMATTSADAAGAFDTKMNIGYRLVGTQFTVVAIADGGYKAVSSYRLTVIAQPALQVVPRSGPVGVYVTLYGSSWQPHRAIYIGMRAIGSSSEAWWPEPVTTDAAGNFSKQAWVGPEYRPYGEVRLMAVENLSTLRLEASYRVVNPPAPTPTPTPIVPAVVISPTVLTVGQVVTVYGTGWPANAFVSLGLGRPAVEEPVGTARAAADGRFTHSFVISERWHGGGQLTLTAWVADTPNGPSATATLWVASGVGRVTPSGLPMEVSSYKYKSSTAYIKVQSKGWQPGQSVTFSIISADGALNIPVGSATVREDGSFGSSFEAASPWWGRADVGVRALAQDGQRFSIRYLPFTEVVKVSGGIYRVSGVNWPSGETVLAIAHLQREGEDVDDQVGVVTTDGNGAFDVQVTMPRVPANYKNDLEMTTKDEQYSAVFDL